MVARLERHVERRAARALAGLGERDRLGVLDVRILVPALADDLTVAHDDRADERMVLDLAAAAFRQLERLREVRHARARTRPSYASRRSSRAKIALPGTKRRAPAS